MLTPDDLRNVAFARTWRRNSGYDATEVDELLERVETTLRGKPLVSAREVLTARFSPGRPGRGYKKEQVAKFLDQVALTLMKREVRESGRPKQQRRAGQATARRPAAVAEPKPELTERVELTERSSPAERVGELVPSGREVLASPTGQQPALDKAEVDAFMDRVEATLRGADNLTAQEVLNARFNPPGSGMPGYQEASVFAFLVMVSTIIKQMAPRDRFVPAQRMPIARAFPRALGSDAPQLTPEAIDGVVLNGSTGGEHGYDRAQVDGFLNHVAATLRGAGTLTSRDVQGVVFREGPGAGTGYDRAEVDSLLDLIAEHLDADAARQTR